MKIEFIASGSGGGGGTDTNLGNANLTADNTTRTYKVASGGTITFQNNAGGNALQVNDSANVLIGGATPYTMPNTRGSASQILQQTTAGGTIAFKTLTALMTGSPQTRAGTGRASAVFGQRLVYVPTPENSLTSVGNHTSATTLANTTINGLCDPFRQSSDTNIRMFSATDWINVKFNASAVGNYSFFIVAVQMADTQAIATAPMTFIDIGDIELDSRSINADEWACAEFPLGELGAELTNCTCYWVGVSLDFETEEAMNMQMIATYCNPKEVSLTFA